MVIFAWWCMPRSLYAAAEQVAEGLRVALAQLGGHLRVENIRVCSLQQQKNMERVRHM